MRKFLSLIITLLSLLSVGGCMGVEAVSYKNETPQFNMKEYFNGDIEAWGIFQDFKGKVSNKFYVRMNASWNGDVGTLKEKFKFSDGTTQERTWTIKLKDANNFSATAGDVIGEAKGEIYGNAVRMQYVLDLPVKGKNYKLNMDDWMYLMDNEYVINKTKMKKFGVSVGELTLFFRKLK